MSMCHVSHFQSGPALTEGCRYKRRVVYEWRLSTAKEVSLRA